MYIKLSFVIDGLKKFLKVVEVIVSEEPITIKIAAWSVTKEDVEIIDILSNVQPLIENEQLWDEILNNGFYSDTLILLNEQLENDLVIAEVHADSSYPIPLLTA